MQFLLNDMSDLRSQPAEVYPICSIGNSAAFDPS